jgi:hypothetical protein
MLKRTRRFIVVEGVDKAQSLVKKLLRLRIVRGNRVMEIAQPGYERDRTGLGVRGGMGGMVLCCRAQTKAYHADNVSQNSHLVNPPDFSFGMKGPKGAPGGNWCGKDASCKWRQLMPN